MVALPASPLIAEQGDSTAPLTQFDYFLACFGRAS